MEILGSSIAVRFAGGFSQVFFSVAEMCMTMRRMLVVVIASCKLWCKEICVGETKKAIFFGICYSLSVGLWLSGSHGWAKIAAIHGHQLYAMCAAGEPVESSQGQHYSNGSLTSRWLLIRTLFSFRARKHFFLSSHASYLAITLDLCDPDNGNSAQRSSQGGKFIP